MFSSGFESRFSVSTNISDFKGITRGGCCHPAPVEKPAIEDNGGSLKVDDHKITTAGGLYNRTIKPV